mmetsp:Transcript_13596/g.38911  ORF Transcript_13596/g.38911 Transcript_13596/m.38911 type:complete len:140 (-) Transcript_13596:83-502(-)
MRAVHADLAVLPVVCDTSFRFPTPRYRRHLAETSEELLKEAGFDCGGMQFARAVMRIFQEIAVEFNPQDAESAIAVRALAVQSRLEGNLRPLGLKGMTASQSDEDTPKGCMSDLGPHPFNPDEADTSTSSASGAEAAKP